MAGPMRRPRCRSFAGRCAIWATARARTSSWWSASPTNAVKAAQAATSSIPIVFESVADPVVAGFADSIGRPGRNITGVSNFSADLSPKRFQFLTQMVPSLNRLAVLFNASNPYTVGQRPAIESVAERLHLSVQFVAASTPEEVELAFRTM